MIEVDLQRFEIGNACHGLSGSSAVRPHRAASALAYAPSAGRGGQGYI
jgi:hypothetical protein